MNSLQHLHRVLLIIMDEIDRVCVKYGIEYTIAGGSMLGAVRHGGFIPWDDDMDVALTRDNYIKLLKHSNDFKSEFFLQTNLSDKNFNYGYAKLLLNETKTVEFGHEKTKYKKGIFIDIFPLDNVPEDKNQRKKHNRKNYVLQKMLRQHQKIKDNPFWDIKTRVIFWIIDLVNIFISRDFLIRNLNSNMVAFNDKKTKYVTNLCGMYGYEKESIPIKWFTNYEKIKFEDRYYSVIEEHEKYLIQIYGDYMKVPPVEKRHTHEFEILDFGQY